MLRQCLGKRRRPGSIGDRCVGWVSPYAPSRVVYLQLGHDERAHRSAAYRELVRNAISWSAGR